MHVEYTNSLDGEIAQVIKKKFAKNPSAVTDMLDELIALQQRGIVSVLEGSPAAVRDTYIDIFDVLTADMKSVAREKPGDKPSVPNRTSKRP